MGYYKDSRETITCTACPPFTYLNATGSTSSAACKACPANSQSPYGTPNIADCLCYKGYRRSGETCEGCTAGYYSDYLNAPVCSACGPNQYSTVALSQTSANCEDCVEHSTRYSISIASCLCNAGYHDNDPVTITTLQCDACSLGYHKPSLGNVSCSICPSNTYADQVGSTACLSCIAHAYTGEGSDSITDCLCGPGYEYDMGACNLCPMGKYKEGYSNIDRCIDCPIDTFLNTTGASNSSQCIACPAHAVSPAGSSFMSNCSCIPGYHPVDHPGVFTCDECGGGRFSTLYNQSNCDVCPVGTYSTVNAASDASTCHKCPENSSSPEQSSSITACQCNVGHFGRDGTACTPCPVGTYKELPGEYLCIYCMDGTYSVTAASHQLADCTACPLHSTSFGLNKASLSACVCDPGYDGEDGVCVACPAGSYKASYGHANCTPCEANFYSTTEAASSPLTCQPCRSNSVSEMGSGLELDCKCLQGFGYAVTTCNQCSTGYYKETISNRACEACSVNTYNTILQSFNASDCKACPLYTHSPAASSNKTDCLCNVGYSGPAGGPCNNCPDGYFGYYDGIADSICVPCGYGSTNGAGHLSCEACGAGYYGPELANPSCLPCFPGSYQQHSNQSQCTLCPLGTASAANTSDDPFTCQNCSAGYYAPLPGTVECFVCPGGTYSGDASSECIPCQSGWVSGPGMAECVECSYDKYADANATTCLRCPVGTFSGAGKTSCVRCDPGYILSYSDNQCYDCPNNTYSDEYGLSCLACPSGSYSGNASGSVFDCRCSPGYNIEFVGGVYQCMACLPGSFRDNNMLFCSECEAGTFTSSLATSACTQCYRGTYQDLPGQVECIPCGYNTYQAFLGASNASACLPCPEHSVTARPAQYDQSVCECLPGYGFLRLNTSEMVCKACAPGYFKAGTFNGACSPCGIGYFTAESGSFLCDECPAGTYGISQGLATCPLCPIGKFSNSRQQVLQGCSTCPDGMTTAAEGNILVSNCQCMPGYTPKDASNPLKGCRKCNPGEYKPGVNNLACYQCAFNTYQPNFAAQTTAECLSCPASSVSLPGSNSIDDCVCNAGYARVKPSLNVTLCEPCIAGFAKPQQGNWACNACPIGYYSATPASTLCTPCTAVGLYTTTVSARSNSSDRCQCMDAYGLASINGTRKTCVPCPTLTFKQGINDMSCIGCPRTESLAAHYTLVNYHCEVQCDFGYVKDEVYQSCQPFAQVEQPYTLDMQLTNVSGDGYHDVITANLYVQYPLGQAIPLLYLAASPLPCDSCCLPYLLNASLGSLLPASLSVLRQRCPNMSCTCAATEELLLQLYLPYDQDTYEYMQLEPIANGVSRLRIHAAALEPVITCTPWGGGWVNCSFYVATTFITLDRTYGMQYHSVYHSVSYSRGASSVMTVVQRVRPGMVDHLSMSLMHFAGTQVFAAKFFFHGEQPLLLRAQAITYLTRLGDWELIPEQRLCGSIVPIPACWQANGMLREAVVMDASTVGTHCQNLFSWQPGLPLYIIFSPPPPISGATFDTLRTTLLLSDTEAHHAFTGVALTGKQQEVCTTPSAATDTRTLSAAFKLGLNNTWREYSPGMQFGSISLQGSLLSVRIDAPAIHKIEVVMIHTIGGLLPGLIQGLIKQGRLFDYQGTSHLVLSDVFQRACFEDYPMHCVTQTTSVGLLEVTRIPDTQEECLAIGKDWMVNTLQLYPNIAASYTASLCKEMLPTLHSYFWMATSYHWPPTFTDWLNANKLVTSFIHIAVPGWQTLL